LHQAHVADERGGGAVLAVRIVVAQRERKHRAILVHRGLEKGGPERQHAGAVAGRSFRKDRNRAAGAEERADFPQRASRRAPVAPPQQHRPGACEQNADRRPRAELVFGDEGRRANGVEHEHVQPGDVVGDQQGAVWSGHARQAQLDAQHL